MTMIDTLPAQREDMLMADPTAAHPRVLGDYLTLARGRWMWIAVCVILGVLASLAYLQIAQKSYLSTSKVLVESTGTETSATGARTSDSVNLDTEAQLVKSVPVSARAAESLGTDLSPVVLSQRVTVTVPPNTTVLDIEFSASTAEAAQQGAQTFALAYLEDRRESAQAALDADFDRLQSQIEQTTEQLGDVNQELQLDLAATSAEERALLIARRDQLSTQLASLNSGIAPLAGATVTPGEVIFEAQMPSSPSSPNPLLLIPSGIMLGLLVGLGLAAWRERADKRIHDASELERIFGLVPLASLSRSWGRDTSFGRADHDVRGLYHSVRAHGPDTKEVTLLVGPDASAATAEVSAALSVVAARSGARTTQLTGVSSSPSLDGRRDELVENGSLTLLDYEELGLLVDGEVRSPALDQELRRLRSNSNFVVLGLPNDDPLVDLPILGRYIDVALVIVHLGVTTRTSLSQALEALTNSGNAAVFAVAIEKRRRSRRTRSSEVTQRPVVASPDDKQPAAVRAVNGKAAVGPGARFVGSGKTGASSTKQDHDGPRPSLKPSRSGRGSSQQGR
jgi:capsular polysaccharide biosynthesis protein